jgi:hypothetical protein
MKRVRLGSSAIEAVAYNEMQRTLEIEFRDGGRYRYLKVPFPVYRALLKAQSAGAFWNQVKDDFEFVKLD